jgi:hypothetical protein
MQGVAEETMQPDLEKVRDRKVHSESRSLFEKLDDFAAQLLGSARFELEQDISGSVPTRISKHCL